MFSPAETQALAILQAAAASTLGIVLRTSNPTRARQILYRVRTEFASAAFSKLQLRVSPDDAENEIWILHPAALVPTVMFDFDQTLL